MSSFPLTELGHYRSVLVFASGVEHARHVAQEIQLHGFEAQVLLGETPREERAGTLERFAAGELRYVVNVECLTTGLDVERIDAIACLRPTWSTGLWVQMVGRGLRKHPDKADTLVLDFAGNALRHGPLDCLDPQVIRKGDGTGEAPAKACPECHEVVPTGCRACICGYQWPAPKVRHDAHAGDAAIIGPQKTRHEVTRVRVTRHEKPGRPPTLRVSYHTPEGWFSEWICFEHDGYAQKKAGWWWSRRFGYPVPTTVDRALATPDLERRIGEMTAAVKLDHSKQFAHVVGHTLRKHQEAPA